MKKLVKVELLNDGGYSRINGNIPVKVSAFHDDGGRVVKVMIDELRRVFPRYEDSELDYLIWPIGHGCRIIEEEGDKRTRRRIELNTDNAALFDRLTNDMGGNNSDKLSFILREAEMHHATQDFIDQQHDLIVKLRTELCGLLADNAKLTKETSDRKIAYKALADCVAGEE